MFPAIQAGACGGKLYLPKQSIHWDVLIQRIALYFFNQSRHDNPRLYEVAILVRRQCNFNYLLHRSHIGIKAYPFRTGINHFLWLQVTRVAARSK